jgi:outer membrane lipoprotein-sorting protein
MADHQMKNNPDDLVENAIASLRERADAASTAYPIPSPGAIEQTLARLSPAQSSSRMNNWRLIMKKPAFRLSAAAVFAVGVIAAVWMLAMSPRVALADALAKVSMVHSVAFKLVTTPGGSSSGSAREPVEIIIAEPARMRQVSPSAGGMISIWDSRAGKLLMLDPKRKIAIVIASTSVPAQAAQANMLERIKRLDAKDFDRIGERKIDGRAAQGFKRKAESEAIPGMPTQETIWVDQETMLPVEIQTSFHGGGLPATAMVMRDFKWDVPIDDAMFDQTPPEGYTVQTQTFDASPAAEKDVIEALKTAAELQGNVFPDSFDLGGILKLTTALKKKMPSTGTTDGVAMRAALMPAMNKVVRGLAFVTSKNGSDFHYAGKNVKLKQPNTPVLWYLPVGSTDAYHVINADLSVREVKVDQLPKVPSVQIHSTVAPTRNR